MNEGMLRIYFSLGLKEWHQLPNEGLWAEPLGEAKPDGAYRLKNSPFYVRGVSFLDVVRAAPRSDGGPGLEFAGVIEHNGNSTYRLLVPVVAPEFEAYWKKLSDLGCTYESTTMNTSFGERILYTVDVPREADIYAVYAVLEQGQRNSVWMFEEGHVGHKLKSR